MKWISLLMLFMLSFSGCSMFSSNVYKDRPFTQLLRRPEKLTQGIEIKIGDFDFSGQFDGGIYYSTWDFQVPNLVGRHPVPENISHRVMKVIIKEFETVGYDTDLIETDGNFPILTGQVKSLKIKSFICGNSPYDASEIEIALTLHEWEGGKVIWKRSVSGFVKYTLEIENYSSNVIGHFINPQAAGIRYKITKKDMLKNVTQQAIRKLLTSQTEEGKSFRSAFNPLSHVK